MITRTIRAVYVHQLNRQLGQRSKGHSTMATIKSTVATRPIIVYAIAGSQFVFKVLAAISSRDVPHYVYLVPMDTKKETRSSQQEDRYCHS